MVYQDPLHWVVKGNTILITIERPDPNCGCLGATERENGHEVLSVVAELREGIVTVDAPQDARSPKDLCLNGVRQSFDFTFGGGCHLDVIGHGPALQPEFLLEHRERLAALLRLGECNEDIG